MKFSVVTVSAILLFTLQSSPLDAGELLQKYRGEADQYHQAQDYKKAYKTYFKLAKIGDHYSQDRIASMYANGEGKKTDLADAYAWAVLAAEGGDEELVAKRDELLQQASDKTKAQEEAAKLKEKYGKLALEKKAAKREEMTGGGACTNSRIGCS
jgi:TPR repeat protein